MDEQIDEVIVIVGEKFSRLQIEKALIEADEDVDDAIDALLTQEKQAPLFSKEVIACVQGNPET